MKYFLLLSICLFAPRNGYTNVIDLLSTKEEVLKFLAASVSKNGIIFPDRCEPIFMSDTDIHSTEFETRPYTYQYNQTTKINDHNNPWYSYPWNFYKADIDGNGRTDLVIDAGLIIIVMDIGDHYEGHLIIDGVMADDGSRWVYNRNSYSFKNFILLHDGTRALALRHDHNPCKSLQHAGLNGNVTYITNTITDNTGNVLPLKVDTIYKITSGIDSFRQRIYGTDSFETTLYNFADTVDMRLYNVTDTIVYKFNGFTTYKPAFKYPSISKVGYRYFVHTDMVIPESPSNFEIRKNGRCFLLYGKCFSAVLDSTRLEKLWDFISYIDPKTMYDFYSCPVDHGAGCIFEFYFDDGSVKAINIWNHRLPMALGYLSKLFSDIVGSLNWQPTNRPMDFELPNESNINSNYSEADDCQCN